MLDSGDSSIRAPRSEYPVQQMLKELIAELEFGLERVSEAAERGELKIDGTKIKVRRLTAQRTPADLKGVRRELYSANPRVQVPDLIMTVDAETHFSAEILGRPADNETELLHLYAGILGQSMDLSANRLSLMVGLTPEGLSHDTRPAGHLQRSVDHDHAAAGRSRDRRDPRPGTLENRPHIHRYSRLFRLWRQPWVGGRHPDVSPAQEPQ
jgi:hypothetical protein